MNTKDYGKHISPYWTKNALQKLNNEYSSQQINKLFEAKILLKELGLPKNQYGSRNNRSAWILLALANIQPTEKWSDATNKFLTTHEIREFIEAEYGMKYAPNSRESFRKDTLHVFEQGMIVIRNKDNLGRATNSKNNNYSINDALMAIIKEYPEGEWKKQISIFNESVPTLRELYERELDAFKIPITLPNGDTIKLSPGKHNQLHADIVHEFCSRFIGEGGRLLYLGDTASSRKEGGKLMYMEKDYLSSLGIPPLSHDKLPDVIVYDEKNNWLFLIEAVTSHGPISPKRWIQLNESFNSCKSGIVFVSAFPDRSILRKNVANIAWETEVWIADNPDHMIHFNGDKFLGPHENEGSNRNSRIVPIIR